MRILLGGIVSHGLLKAFRAEVKSGRGDNAPLSPPYGPAGAATPRVLPSQSAAPISLMALRFREAVV
jgi:hypothetical protein